MWKKSQGSWDLKKDVTQEMLDKRDVVYYTQKIKPLDNQTYQEPVGKGRISPGCRTLPL